MQCHLFALHTIEDFQTDHKPQKKIHAVHNEECSDDDDYLGINCVKNKNAQDSIWITPTVNGKEIKKQLDTGSICPLVLQL
jgi:hypothetical protein